MLLNLIYGEFDRSRSFTAFDFHCLENIAIVSFGVYSCIYLLNSNNGWIEPLSIKHFVKVIHRDFVILIDYMY